jgi:hypothetical protein
MENILQTALDSLLAEREKLGDLDALVAKRDLLDTQIAQLKGILEPTTAKVKKTRNLSPESRQRIAEGQRRRWQKTTPAEAPAAAPVE